MRNEARFWAKAHIGAPDECWTWQGATENGAGVYRVRGEGNHRAARFAWMYCYGDVPDDMHVQQTCGNPLCVNPAHLDLAPGATGPSGQDHPNAVLSPEDIPHIRAALADGVSYYALARQYRVNKNTIRQIALGITWIHIT